MKEYIKINISFKDKLLLLLTNLIDKKFIQSNVVRYEDVQEKRCNSVKISNDIKDTEDTEVKEEYIPFFDLVGSSDIKSNL